MRPLRRLALVSALGLTGCGGDEADTDASSGAGAASGHGGSAGEGPCPDTEVPLAAGGCVVPGVPPDACGAGFEPDGANGCEPVLPSTPCGKGSMAVPGETDCHDVGTCLDDAWRGIGTDATTQFVDAAFAGSDSDGTLSKPWTTIAEAIAAATSGAIVAIAAGSYPEDVEVTGKAVRLWGRCPAMVEITGSTAEATLTVRQDAIGSEVRNLSVTGSGYGILVLAADVMIDSVWIHETEGPGVIVRDQLAEASVTIDRSLLETARDVGVGSIGGMVEVLRSAVRDVRPATDGTHGRGIEGILSPDTGNPARVSIVGSVVERNHDLGVSLHGSIAHIEATLVQDTLPQPADLAAGRGVNAQPLGFTNFDTALRSELTMLASVVRRNSEIGMFLVGSDASIEASVVRDTLAQAADQRFGRGIETGGVLIGDEAFRGTLSVRSSLMAQNRDVAIFAADSEVTLTATRIDGTLPKDDDGARGDGLAAFGGDVMTTIRVESAWIEQSARAGISCFGANIEVTATRLECNAIHLDGEVLFDTPFQIVDHGQNRCGCGGVEEPCTVKTTSLEPPEPLLD